MTRLSSVLTVVVVSVVVFGAGGACRDVPRCASDAECTEYGTCFEGLCVARACATSRDCPASASCDQGSCQPRPTCNTDDACAEGYCGAGVCQRNAECEPACGENQDCASGVCVPRYLAVELTAPLDGGCVGAAAAVTAKLHMNAGRTPPATERLEFAARAIPPTKGNAVGWLVPAGDGGFEGSWSPAEAGEYLLELRHPPTGLGAGARVTVDLTPPEVSLLVPAPSRLDGGVVSERDPQAPAAYRRDEELRVTLDVVEPNLDLASTKLTVLDAQGATLGQVLGQEGTCPGKRCVEFELDLATVPFPVFRANLVLKATAVDLAGNVSSVLGALPVTRFKWGLEAKDALIAGAPAVDPELGTVFVALGAPAARLMALNPDGSLKWSVPGKSGYAGALFDAATRQVVVNEFIGSGSQLFAYAAATGAARPLCPPEDGYPAGALALVHGPTNTFVTATVQSVSGTVTGASLPDGARCPVWREAGVPALEWLGPIAAGAKLFSSYFAEPTRFIGGYGLSAAEDTWSLLPAWPVSAFATRAMVSDGESVILISEENFSGTFLSTIPLRGGALAGRFPADGVIAGAVSVVATGPRQVVVTSSQGLKRVTLEGAGRVEGTEGGLPTSGELAAGAGGRFYVASVYSDLATYDRQLKLEWRVESLLKGPARYLNLDCARSSLGAQRKKRPGVLYVGSSAELLAVIVDSPGLDAAAPWPLHRHDPSNTNNAATALAPFSCE